MEGLAPWHSSRGGEDRSATTTRETKEERSEQRSRRFARLRWVASNSRVAGSRRSQGKVATGQIAFGASGAPLPGRIEPARAVVAQQARAEALRELRRAPSLIDATNEPAKQAHGGTLPGNVYFIPDRLRCRVGDREDPDDSTASTRIGAHRPWYDGGSGRLGVPPPWSAKVAIAKRVIASEYTAFTDGNYSY